MTLPRLVIFGTGGFAREVHQLVEDVNALKPTWDFVGFLDGNQKAHGTQVHGMPVLGGVEWLAGQEGINVVIGVGGTPSRSRIAAQISQTSKAHFPVLIHPLAWVGNRVDIGEGTIVCAGTRITTDIRIGRHALLNLDVTVGHDCDIRDFCTFSPGANISGNVRIGVGCDIGTNATVIQGLSIGHWTVVGAGAVVVKDLGANITAVGSPAKPIKERLEGWHLA